MKSFISKLIKCLKDVKDCMLRILNTCFPSNYMSDNFNSNILYFLSTSLLISLIASVIFKLFESNVFCCLNIICGVFYLIFYLFPVFIGYLLANKLKVLENDIEASTAYDRKIYAEPDSIKMLYEIRDKKKNKFLTNDEYKNIGVKIGLYLLYILYILIFTIYIISKGFIKL